LDLCTGSGCVAISLALVKQLAGRAVVATDLSADALALASENAATHQVSDRVEFVQGNLFEALSKTEHRGPYAAVVSNPPYIPDHEWAQVEPNVRNHEPTLALRGGVEGLDLVRPIVQQAGAYLADGGLLAVEVAASTAEVVRALFESAGLSDVQVLPDFERLPRVVTGIRRV
jgi:release factor glutamine methyltransferase